MHLLTSTVLFMDDQAVDYNLFFNPDTYRYLFNPLSVTNAWYALPSFWVYKKDSEWHLDGVKSDEIRQQAVCQLTPFL